MKHIITFLQKCISKELPKPVGRWRIENCNSQLNRKIDLSNEDHCGPCGQYLLEKTEVDAKRYVHSTEGFNGLTSPSSPSWSSEIYLAKYFP